MLEERIEAAEGPSRELDEAILREAWVIKRGQRADLGPHFTASIDAAMTLVPEGCGFLLTATHIEHWASIVVEGKLMDGTLTTGPSLASSRAATPALALCAAALKARKADNG